MTPEEKVKRLNKRMESGLEAMKFSTKEERAAYYNGFHCGYAVATLDVVEIALQKFCEIKCEGNCEQPFCGNKMDFRRELKQHLL